MKKSIIYRLIPPTILCVLGIIPITAFSALMYYFGDGQRKLGEFLIVFSPTIILLILLFVAWRWRFIGGTILVIVGLGIFISYLIVTHDSQHFVGTLITAFLIGIPTVLSGILFRKTRNLSHSSPQDGWEEAPAGKDHDTF